MKLVLLVKVTGLEVNDKFISGESVEGVTVEFEGEGYVRLYRWVPISDAAKYQIGTDYTIELREGKEVPF